MLFMWENYFTAKCGNKYPAPLLLMAQDVIDGSGSDHTRSLIGPASGIYFTLKMEEISWIKGILGDRPP